MEFKWYVDLVRKRWVLIAFCIAGAVMFSMLFIKKTAKSGQNLFRASDLIYLNNESQMSFQPRKTNLNSDTGTRDRIYLESLRALCTPVAKKVIRKLDLDISAEALLENIDFSYSFNENIMEISYMGNDTKNTKQIIDKFADYFVDYFVKEYHVTNQEHITNLDQKIAKTAQELKTLPQDSPSYEIASNLYEDLNDQIRRIRLADEINPNPYSIIRYSAVESILGPQIPIDKRLFSLPVGFFFGLGMSIALEYVKNNSETFNELENRLGVSSLALLENLQTSEASNGTKLDMDSENLQAFELVRAKLTAFVDKRRIRIFLFCSIGRNGLFAPIIYNLLKMLARSGKRILVISTEEESQLASRFLCIDNGVGLNDVLTKDVPVENVLSETKIHNVRGITKGSDVDDKVGILYSKNFDKAMAKLKTLFDLIIIEATSMNETLDFLPLAQKVEGTIMLVALGSTKIHFAENVAKTLVQLDSPVLGFIGITPKR